MVWIRGRLEAAGRAYQPDEHPAAAGHPEAALNPNGLVDAGGDFLQRLIEGELLADIVKDRIPDAAEVGNDQPYAGELHGASYEQIAPVHADEPLRAEHTLPVKVHPGAAGPIVLGGIWGGELPAT